MTLAGQEAKRPNRNYCNSNCVMQVRRMSPHSAMCKKEFMQASHVTTRLTSPIVHRIIKTVRKILDIVIAIG
eukprot:3386428-Amphidinium_carterae.1